MNKTAIFAYLKWGVGSAFKLVYSIDGSMSLCKTTYQKHFTDNFTTSYMAMLPFTSLVFQSQNTQVRVVPNGRTT